MAEAGRAVRVGLEVWLESGAGALRGARAGLITNPSGIDRDFVGTVERLRSRTDVDIVCLFGPEHGVRGDAQAGVHVTSTTDARSGLAVHSLYGATRGPDADVLSTLDLLIFDLQDIGVRYATYLSTMLHAQEACVEAGIAFLVLDRPNPLGGSIFDGGTLEPDFASFVGAYPLPVRHGMTLGEIARLVAAERGWPAPLVVPIDGWRREMWYDQTELPWVQPSPNLPTLDAVTLYPGTCLLEGTNISEGRGTTRPFEMIGAPWIEPHALAAELTARRLPGFGFRPAWFTPMYSKHAGLACGGVQVYVLDRQVARSAELGLHLLAALKRVAPDTFSWIRTDRDMSFVDLLLGSACPRQAVDEGIEAGELVAAWREQHRTFAGRRQQFLLYED